MTMGERAKVSGGWLRVGAGEGGGTTLSFWLPCDAESDVG